jgi:hypothetical protein
MLKLNLNTCNQAQVVETDANANFLFIDMHVISIGNE